ncbi:hypothetical protein CEY16_13765 [Halalkalibacillus sediminis]|uniref:Uncharacterized protein n=1 Tax=Halalkalibacillus sediminis TaxID=2018042 RepID=A0A2I0QRB3_9BACI|nr:hypothetical protein [Halalkalibacillus sediminis]PKR76874.1 hypothetical protein CEY16_13765 [Halalkalibacillus sediminis]
MNLFIRLFSAFPVHILMVIISAPLVLSTLRNHTSSSLLWLSIILLVVNIAGYILASYLLLKKYRFKDILLSTGVIFLIGFTLQFLVQLTENLFFSVTYLIYNSPGVGSMIGIFQMTNDFLSLQIGSPLGIFMNSIFPPILILIGFGLTRKVVKPTHKHQFILITSCIIFSKVIVLATGVFGKSIHTQEELRSAFPMETGFPFHFAELRYPNIDPPLPHTFRGFDCCSVYVNSWSNYWLSFFLIATIVIILAEVTYLLFKKYSSEFKKEEANNQ